MRPYGAREVYADFFTGATPSLETSTSTLRRMSEIETTRRISPFSRTTTPV